MEDIKSDVLTAPKIIHCVWLGGKNKNPDQQRRIDSWKKCCPDYEIMEWNESNFDINSCDFVREAYENKKFAFAADYVRLKALYEYGGVYLDMDVELIKSFDDLLNYDSVVGFENGAYIGMGTILCKPGQKWIKEQLEIYENSHFKRGKKFDMDANTIKTTAIFKKHYGLKINGKRQDLKDGIKIFPREYFCPKDFTTGKTTVTENTYAIHLYDATWLAKDKPLYKFLRFIRNVVGLKAFDGLTRFYTKIKVRSLEKRYWAK